MPLVLNVAQFWIYQASEYASGFEYSRILKIIFRLLLISCLDRVLNMPGLPGYV